LYKLHRRRKNNKIKNIITFYLRNNYFLNKHRKISKKLVKKWFFSDSIVKVNLLIKDNLKKYFNKIKIIKFPLFVSYLTHIDYNSTFKQYYFLINLGYKNSIYLPFFSLFSLENRFIQNRVVAFDKTLLNNFISGLHYSKYVLSTLKKFNNFKKSYLKLLNYYKKIIVLNNYFQKFYFSRLNLLRNLNLESFNKLSNRAILFNTKKVYKFFLNDISPNLIIFAWRNYSNNFIWNNFQIYKFYKMKKLKTLFFSKTIRKVQFFDKMPVIIFKIFLKFIFNLINFLKNQMCSLILLKFFFFFFFKQYILQLCRSLIN
jgi:hypothetical protein